MSAFASKTYTLTYEFDNEDHLYEFEVLAELMEAALTTETVDQFNEVLGALVSTICQIRLTPQDTEGEDDF